MRGWERRTTRSRRRGMERRMKKWLSGNEGGSEREREREGLEWEKGERKYGKRWNGTNVRTRRK